MWLCNVTYLLFCSKFLYWRGAGNVGRVPVAAQSSMQVGSKYSDAPQRRDAQQTMALMRGLMLSVAQSPGCAGVRFMDLQSLHLRLLTVSASVLLVSALILSCTTLSIRADIYLQPGGRLGPDKWWLIACPKAEAEGCCVWQCTLCLRALCHVVLPAIQVWS